MTRGQIGTKIRDNLDDAGITYYSSLDITDSIQDGYDEVAVYSECIEKWVALPQIINTTYYDFSELIPDYYRVIDIYGFEFKNVLDPVNDRDLLSYRIDWELYSGGSREFMVLGPKYIGINGRKSVVGSNNTFRIYYKAQANILVSDSETPRINNDYQILLEWYGTADLLEQNQEYTKANGYWVQYNDMLEKYRYKIQLLSKSDRIFNREGYVYYGY